jgi:3-isopropylmalate dehydratase
MPTAEGRPRTLYDKVFQDHIVDERLDGTILLYIGALTFFHVIELTFTLTFCTDRHLVHEVTSPVRSFCFLLAKRALIGASSKLLRD